MLLLSNNTYFNCSIQFFKGSHCKNHAQNHAIPFHASSTQLEKHTRVVTTFLKLLVFLDISKYIMLIIAEYKQY